MGAASWGSVLSSLITYLQRLGITVSLDSVPLPPKMKEILSSIYMFYERIQQAIPTFPDFDLRSQLMLLALGIPFILDVVFVWFINPIGVTLTHVLDLVAFGVGTYFITSSVVGNWSLINISVIAICAVFIVLRIIFTFLTKQKGDLELYVLVDEICNYYMQGILPDKKCELSFRELNLAIHKFSQIIEIVPPKANLLVSYSFLGVSFVLFFLSFWCLDAFPIPYDFPEIVSLILPLIGIPLAVVFYTIFVLRLFHCGRYFLTLVKQFIRRWGLRILMMALDILYIPILTVLISMITPEQIGCPVDQYLYYQVVNKDIIYYPFINHTASCRKCVAPEYRSNFCDFKCSGATELRMKLAPDLLFVDDVIAMTGGLILYTLAIVMVGLPFLWYYIIKRNQMYIDRINVYGATETIKYGAIIHRLHSTGVFLFQDYKSNFTMWGVALIGMKFVLMVLSLFADTFSDKLLWTFPFYYTITFLLHVILKPYLYKFNTIFESTMEFVNILFAIFSIIAYLGIVIPDSVSMPLSIICLVIPLLSVAFILCCEGKEGTAKDLDDPTFIRKADTKHVKTKHHEHIADKDDKGDRKKKKKDSSNKLPDMKNGKLVEQDTGNIVPASSSLRLPEIKQDFYKPNTSRAHYHPVGHASRPATPLLAVSGVPSRFPTRPQTAEIFYTDSDYDDDSDDSYSLDGNLANGDGGRRAGAERKKRKHRHHHFHDQDRIEVDSDGVEHVISNKVELEAGMLDSILELKARQQQDGQVSPDDIPLKECFTVRKKSAARRMTKMYKTLDIVLDGSTIDRLTKILNNALIIGVIAVGWYLGALVTNYQYSTNFTCG